MPIDTPLGVAILDPGVTARGTDQAGATQLSALTSIIASSTAGSGVKILAAANYTQTLTNASGNQINIYPAVGMAISPNAVGVPAVLDVGRSIGIIVANSAQAYIVFNTSSFG